MDQQQNALLAFVKLHGSRLKVSCATSRVAHLARYSKSGNPLDIALEMYTIERVIAEMDKESPPVRWLIRQIQTYDTVSQRVLGLIFDPRTAYAHVIECGVVREA